jgi:hypothetical protein
MERKQENINVRAANDARRKKCIHEVAKWALNRTFSFGRVPIATNGV